MSNVIDFLEHMGRDAELRHSTKAQFEQALANAQFSPELRTAIATGDLRQLETVLGVQANACAIIFPVETEDRNDGYDQTSNVTVVSR